MATEKGAFDLNEEGKHLLIPCTIDVLKTSGGVIPVQAATNIDITKSCISETVAAQVLEGLVGTTKITIRCFVPDSKKLILGECDIQSDSNFNGLMISHADTERLNKELGSWWSNRHMAWMTESELSNWQFVGDYKAFMNQYRDCCG